MAIDSVNRRDTITVNWTVSGKNNKILRFRFALGECYSAWDSIVVSDVDSVAQIMIGSQSVCEDSYENYSVQTVPPNTHFRWSVDTVFGTIFNQSVDHATINWKKLKGQNDTTIFLNYYDTLCGNSYEINYPVTIHKRSKAVIENTDACAGKDIQFSINVKSATYIWDFGDTIITNSNDTIIHKFKEKGFYQVNVRWNDSTNCVDGFSASKEIEVNRTITPYIQVFNDSTNAPIICLSSEDTIRIRFVANQFDDPDLKYKWYIDNTEQTSDTTYILIRTHPTDFDFTNKTIKLVLDGMICSDTTYINLPSCGSGDSSNYNSCVPLDNVVIKNVIDSTCDIRNVEGQFLANFNSFIEKPRVIGTPGTLTPSRGYWIFEDAHPALNNVRYIQDLNQTHTYEMAGNWLILLSGNARDSQDTSKVCPVSDHVIETVPVVNDFIYTFTCDSNGYNIKLKPQVTYLEGYQPVLYTYTIDDNEPVQTTDEVTEIHINNGASMVCLETSVEMDLPEPCIKCKAITVPPVLIAPEIIVNDTICEGTVLYFDIEDAEFTDDITEYLWDFGDGDSSKIRRPSHKYINSDTTIQVGLHVKNKWGCETMSSRLVYISPNTLNGHLTVDSMPCISHKQLNFIKNVGTEPLTYKWSTTETDSSITVNATGKYSITVKDRYGCELKLYQDIRVNEPFTRGFEAPDSICANESNPFLVFYGDSVLFDFLVVAKEISTGHLDTITFSGTNPYFFFFDIEGKTGTYQIIIKAKQNGSQMVCDSIVRNIKINPSDVPSIQDSLFNCKPFTYILSESHNYNMDWYSVGNKNLFLIDTGSQVAVHKGGTYIGFYKNAHGCIESDTIDVDDQINLRPFLSGCYNICDTLIDKGTTFIPILDDPTIYTWWKYKHLDSNLVIKQGTNSRVDSFLLQKKHAGKMYLVVQAQNGCIDSSDFLCLVVDRCVPPIDCDTVSMTCPHLSFIKDTFECDSMFGYYSVFGDIVVGNDGFTLCTPNPFIIDNFEWIEQPTITITGHTIHFSGGKLRMHVDSCTGTINISVRLCKDGAECIQELAPYDFECWHNTCGLYYHLVTPQANGTHTLQVSGYVDNIANCDTIHKWIRVRLFDGDCAVGIGNNYPLKKGFNEFLTTFTIPDTSIASCYCLKVCLSSATNQCETLCEIPNICTGLDGFNTAGGRGGIYHNIECASQTTTGYYNYDYDASFDSTGTGYYLDSFSIADVESSSYSCSEGMCSGHFQEDSTSTTVDFTYYIRNPDFPLSIIGIDSTLSLPNCGMHPLKSGNKGIKNLIGNEKSVIGFDVTENSTRLYLLPNPTNLSTTIYYHVADKEDGWEIRIFDFSGKEFARKICYDLSGNFKFDCSNHAAGMYFVVLSKNGKITSSKKLLITD